jgi:SAM-dependent methyltransferase
MTYQAMAAVYDRLMLHVNYEKWVDGLEFQWKRLGKNPRTVLDAGCGTGSVLLPLAGRGYQVYGIDNSGDMLAVCRDKLLSRSLSAVLLEMDIRKVRLPEQVDTAICLCDTLNYLVKENDLLKCFKSIFSVLKPGGSFVKWALLRQAALAVSPKSNLSSQWFSMYSFALSISSLPL